MPDLTAETEGVSAHDWTADPETGASNSSPEFIELAQFVSGLIRNEAHRLLDGHSPESAGRLIMAQLAHVKNVGPLPAEVAEA
jgi:hypothetical protein